MKKNSILVLLIVAFTITLTACNQKGYQSYVDSLKKYSEVRQGKDSMHIKLDLDFNTVDLTDKEIRELSELEEMRVDLNVMYDYDKVLAKTHCMFGGIGYDANYYQKNKEERMLEIPMLNKYFDMANVEKYNKNSNQLVFDKESIKKFNEIWVDTFEENDVIVGKDTIIENEEGNVKATVYTINITEEQ